MLYELYGKVGYMNRVPSGDFFHSSPYGSHGAFSSKIHVMIMPVDRKPCS